MSGLTEGLLVSDSNTGSVLECQGAALPSDAAILRRVIAGEDSQGNAAYAGTYLHHRRVVAKIYDNLIIALYGAYDDEATNEPINGSTIEALDPVPSAAPAP